jgi:hypothetical protein
MPRSLLRGCAAAISLILVGLFLSPMMNDVLFGWGDGRKPLVISYSG